VVESGVLMVMQINFKKLVKNLAIPLGVGTLASLLTRGSMAEFEMMAKPPLSPPGWLFPVVWTILYILMGIASYIIFEEVKGRQKEQKQALSFYGAQLAVNFIWPIIFFKLKAYTAAVFVIFALLILVIITAARFKALSKTAFWLLVPYIIWLLFATYLNIGVAVLN
jgi:tryptophan-rich sensory protein